LDIFLKKLILQDFQVTQLNSLTEVLSFSLTNTIGLTPRKIRSDVEKAQNELNSRGMETTVYYISPCCFDAFADKFTDENTQSHYDYVVIGAGMRKIDDFTRSFSSCY
jgi:hypothetical protein